MNDSLRASITEAIGTLTAQTGLSAEALFGERVLEPSQMSAVAAHAVGVYRRGWDRAGDDGVGASGCALSATLGR